MTRDIYIEILFLVFGKSEILVTFSFKGHPCTNTWSARQKVENILCKGECSTILF